jgi:2'-5' RNA ligase
MKNNLRLFFAVQLHESLQITVKNLLKQLYHQPWGSKVRWVALENLHVTLRFIGDCPAEKINDLQHEVTRAIKKIKPFDIQLGQIKLFTSPRRPHVVIIDIQPNAGLFELAFAVEHGVVAAGFRAENRPFLPHLSLGRPSQHIHFSETPLPQLTENVLPINEIVLMRSDEVDNKRIYTVIEKIKLKQ